MHLELPLGIEAIRNIDRATFNQVILLARGGDHWSAVRRDAQRTLHRGLDAGVFKLDRRLKIRLATDLDEDGSYVGPKHSDHTTMGNRIDMNMTDFLDFAPKLSDGPLVTAQPSLKEIVQQHYRHAFGEEQGDSIARMYLERIVSTYPVQEASEGAAADAAAGTFPSAENMVQDAGGRAQIAPDMVALRAVVMAIVKHNYRISSGEPTTVGQLDRFRRQWAADPRISGAHPVLALSDAEGGFSLHEESSAYIGNVARRLAADKLIDKDGDAYLPEGILRARAAAALEAEAFAAASADEPSPAPQPEAVRPAQPDPLDGIRDLFKGIGFDLRVGGVDVVKGVERTARTGNALPLVAGLATAVLAAAAAVEANRED